MSNEHSIVIKADTTAVDNMSRSLASLATNGTAAAKPIKELAAAFTILAGNQDKSTESTKRTAAATDNAANVHVTAAGREIAASKSFQDNLGKEAAALEKRNAQLRYGKTIAVGEASGGYDPTVATVRRAEFEMIRANTMALAGMDAAARRAAESKGILAKYSHQFMRTLVDLTPIISGLGLLTLAHGAIQATDKYTKLTSQLKIATNTTAEYAFALSEVKRISSAAQADITAITSLYQRLSLATSASGVSQKEIAMITETVALGLKANGASARESASAMLQLSQSFGSGRMAGEEFNSMAEAAPNVLRALAKSMGVPYGQLKTLASETKITTDVMVKAFTDPALLESFRAQAASMRTITGSWVELTNALVLYVGQTSKSSGIVSVLSGTLSFLANNLKLAADAIITVATVMTAKFAIAFVQSRLLIMAHSEALVMNAARNMESAAATVISARANMTEATSMALLTGNSQAATMARLEYLAATRAATVATTAHTAASAGMISKLGALVPFGKLGWIGLVLFGAYEAADYMGWIDKLSAKLSEFFNTQESMIKRLQLVAGGGVTGDAMAEALRKFAENNAKFAAEKAKAEELAKHGIDTKKIGSLSDIEAQVSAFEKIAKLTEGRWKVNNLLTFGQDDRDIARAKDAIEILRLFKIELATAPKEGTFTISKGWENYLTDAQKKTAETAKINELYYKDLGDLQKRSDINAAQSTAIQIDLFNRRSAAIDALDKKESKSANTAAESAAKEVSASQSKIAVMQIEMDGTVKLTDSQKKLIELGYEYVNGVGDMTAATYAKSAALLASTAATELEKQATEAAIKENEHYIDGLLKSADGINKETESIASKLAAVELETASIGKTKAEIANLEAARYDHTTQIMKERLAIIELTGVCTAESVALEEAISVRERYKQAKTEQGTAQVAQAAIDAETKAQKEAIAAQTKAYEEQWKMIDGFAHDAFNNIFDKGKNVFKELGNAIKKYLLDMLYKMTLQKWMISVGIAGTGASGVAAAAENAGSIGSMASGIQNLWNVGSSAVSSLFAPAATGMAAFTSAQMAGAVMSTTYTAPAIATLGAEAGAAASGLGALGSTIATAMPWVAGALALYSLFGGKGGTIAQGLGTTSAIFSPTGEMLSASSGGAGDVRNVTSDAFVQGMQSQYAATISALGGIAASTSFFYGAGQQSDGTSAMRRIAGGVSEGAYFNSGEIGASDAEVSLAASRAIFTALQGSDLPQYLSRMFDGLTASTMTQQDIDNTLVFAGSVKQMRDALLETRAPLEVLRANVDAGTAAFATSAETFRTDFVAAIDAGINPQVFDQWKLLGTAIDQLAAADAEAAAVAAEAAARLAETNLGWQQKINVLTGVQTQRQVDLADALTGADASTASLINQFFALEDAANAAAQAQADAIAAQEKTTALALTNLGWQQQIDVLTGTQTQSQVDLANALVGADASTAALINQLFGLQDAADAAAIAAELAATNLGWQQQIDVLQGTQTQSAVDLANALTGADASTALLITQMFMLQDAANAAAAEALAWEATNAAANEAALAQAAEYDALAQAIIQQRYDLETQLLQAQENTTELRARELLLIDESNRQLQEQIWATQDATLAYEEATLAAEEYIETLKNKAQSDYDAARSATDSLRAFATSVRELQQSLWAGSQTPLESTYDVTRTQFTATSALAVQGDTNAQGNLAGAATAFLDASKKQASSAVEYARDFAMVQNSLSDTASKTENVITVADEILIELGLANGWLTKVSDYTNEISGYTNKMSIDGITANFNAEQTLKFITNADGIPEELRAALGTQSKDFSVTLKAVLDSAMPDDIKRALIDGSGNYDVTVAAAIGTVDEDARTLALDATGTYLTLVNAALGLADDESKILALTAGGDYLATVAAALGIVDPVAKILALNTANALISTVTAALGTTSDKDALTLATQKVNTYATEVTASLATDAGTVGLASLIAGKTASKLTVAGAVIFDPSSPMMTAFDSMVDSLTSISYLMVTQNTSLSLLLTAAISSSAAAKEAVEAQATAATTAATTTATTAATTTATTAATTAVTTAVTTADIPTTEVTAKIATQMEDATIRKLLNDAANVWQWSSSQLDLKAGWPIGTSLQLAKERNIPAFAVGTNVVPFDMTARIHQGEQITPKPFVDSQRAERAETNRLLAELTAEVIQLRAENKAGDIAIERNTSKGAKLLEKIDAIGIDIREAA